MGQCSDLFVATPGEAPLVASTAEPFERWHSVSFKDVLELEWMAFAAAARTDVFDEPLVEGADRVVRPMTRHVVKKLAALEPEERRSLAAAWKTAADTFAQWPLEAVERVLFELSELASRASREGKAVLYLATW